MIYTVNKRAVGHQAHCEDALFHTYRDGWVIAAVFDGCSDGENSHFASQLHAYSLRHALDDNWTGWYQLMNRNDYSIDEVLNSICGILATYVLSSATTLGLTKLELLSTAVIAMYHPKRGYLITKFLGDGAVHVNGVTHRVDSGVENKPDYIAYVDVDDLGSPYYFNDRPTKVFTNVDSWSICTDGIDAMRHPNRPLEECIHYLLDDTVMYQSEVMLGRKVTILCREGMELRDDLTIIRYINAVVQQPEGSSTDN